MKTTCNFHGVERLPKSKNTVYKGSQVSQNASQGEARQSGAGGEPVLGRGRRRSVAAHDEEESWSG